MRTSGPEMGRHPLCHSSTVQTLQGTPHPEILSELGQDSHSSPALRVLSLGGREIQVWLCLSPIGSPDPFCPCPPSCRQSRRLAERNGLNG